MSRTPREFPSGARAFAAGAIAVSVVGAAYAPVLSAPFVWDDREIIGSQPADASLTSLASLFTRSFWTPTDYSDAHTLYYRPLVTASYAIERALGHGAPAYHATNLALHLACVALLFVVARKLGAALAPAAIAAAGWGLFPRLTESAAWIAGRTDVIATLFALAAIALWPSAATREGRAWKVVTSAALLLGALLAKENAIAAPFAIAIADVASAPRDAFGPRARRLAPLGAVLLVYGLIRTSVLEGAASTERPLGAVGRMAEIAESIGRYAAMTIDAWHPASVIGLAGERVTGFVVAGAIVAAGVVACVPLVRARGWPRPGVALGAALAIGAIAPACHLAPLTIAGALVADRFLYLPLAGVAIALASALEAPSPLALSLGGALALSYAPATHARALDYGDEVRFWAAAIATSPRDSTTSLSNLALVAHRAGDDLLALDAYQTALVALDRSGRASTATDKRARENVASTLAELGRYPDALAATEALVSDNAAFARGHVELGFARLHMLDFAGASAAFRDALALSPAFADASRLDASLPQIRTAWEALPPDSDTSLKARHARAVALALVGRAPDAARAWLNLALDPATPPRGLATAASFLASHGQPADARRALDAAMARGAIAASEKPELESTVREREALADSLRARRAEIEAALTAQRAP